jgi:hypothetical protein
MSDPADPPPAGPLVDDRTRTVTAQVSRLMDDVIFVGLVALLAGAAPHLPTAAALDFGRHAPNPTGPAVITLIEARLVVEILYTVLGPFRERILALEPLLLIGLFAALRRVMVISAEQAEHRNEAEDMSHDRMFRRGVLTVSNLPLVASVIMLRRRPCKEATCG